MSVAELDAEVAIRSVMVEYMAACDEPSPDRVAALFGEDGVWEALPWDCGNERLVGPDAVRGSYEEACARLTFRVHFLTNEWISVDGDTAAAEWSYFEPATNRGQLAVWTAGRYHHELRRTNGVWYFSHFGISAQLAAPFDIGWGPDPKVPLL